MSIPRRQSQAQIRSKYDDDMPASPTNGGNVVPLVEAVILSDEEGLKDRMVLKQPMLSSASTASDETKIPTSPSVALNRWPPRLCEAVMRTFTRDLFEKEGKSFLSMHEWPPGLQEALLKSCKKVPLRFFIVDDSGSMNRNDGNKLIRASQGHKVITCTRWAELMASISFCYNLSHHLQCPSEFRLLNGSDPVMIGLSRDDDTESLPFLEEVLAEEPAGSTPLCQHIDSIVENIRTLAPELRKNGQKVAVIIATDGEATDGDVAKSLLPLRELPAWVILRLCTNEHRVVEYWNDIDKQLELEMDVIDDFISDAKEVNEVNPWLVYGEALHRLREFGVSMKDVDMIDESMLSSEQMRNVCGYLLSKDPTKSAKIPHPDEDFFEFYRCVRALVGQNPRVFCPIRNVEHPWIDLVKLKQLYGGKQASSVCSVS